MKRVIALTLVIVMLIPSGVWANDKTISYYNLHEVKVTQEMKKFAYDMCYDKIYTMYQGKNKPRLIGMSFKDEPLTLEKLKKIQNAIILVKAHVYRAVRQNDSNFYGIYVRTVGVRFYADNLLHLWEDGYLFKKNGMKLAVDDYIKKYGGDKEDRYFNTIDSFFNHTFVITTEKTEDGFKYVKASGLKDPDLGWDTFLMFDRVPYTNLDEMAENNPDEYAEYFRKLMTDIISGSKNTDEDIIFKEDSM